MYLARRSARCFATQASKNHILSLASNYLLPVYARPDFVLSEGKGSYVWDTDGKKYLDFSAGIAVNSLGHADEGVLKVLSDQAGKLLHTSNVYHNEWAPQLAELLVEKTREEGGLGFATRSKDTTTARVFFANSGTEANEGALKIARKIGKDRDPSHKKNRIVCFENSFHGRSVCFPSYRVPSVSCTSSPRSRSP
jgi:acetylornithine aminotransferase